MREDSSKDEFREERLSREASEWIARQDLGFEPEDQDAYLEWLAENPENKEMMRRRAAIWKEMDVLADWRPEHSRKPNPDLLAVSRYSIWQRRIAVLVSLAAAFLLGLFLFNPLDSSDRGGKTELVFGVTEDYQNHVLEDGSVLELNKGTKVSVTFSELKRSVMLHSGEAHFMVAKDVDRPFEVLAGGALVRAVGTAFNVSLEIDGVEVLVTEGIVEVDNVSSYEQDTLGSGPLETPALELVAGQRSLVPRQEMSAALTVDHVSPKAIDRRLSWKGELLDFTDTPLFEVVRELNRRNRVEIVLGEEALRNLEITATVRSNNLASFLELLSLTMNIRSEWDGEYRVVLRTETT